MCRDNYKFKLFVKRRIEQLKYNLSWILEKMRRTLGSAVGNCSRSLCFIRLRKSDHKTQDGFMLRKKNRLR